MDLNKIMSVLGSSGIAGGLAGGVAGGALTSAFMGKKGKKHAKTLLKAGGIAAVGGLAWKAYRSYQESRAGSQEAYPTRAETHAPGQSHLAAAPTPAVAEETWQMLPQSSFDIDASSAEGSRGLLLVRAMIAAAMSDGHLDGSERSRIMAKIDELGLDAEERALVGGELLQPKTADAIAAAVGDQATGIEVYAASLLAIDESRHQGRLYLDELARRLNLPPLLIEALGTRVETEREAIAKPATN